MKSGDCVRQKLLQLYNVHYKKLTILSFVLLLACILTIGVHYAQTGELFKKGVSLKGGISMTVPIDTPVSVESFESALASRYPNADVNVREVTEGGKPKALIIEAADVTREDLLKSVPELGVPLVEGKYSTETMGSSLGNQFFAQTAKAVIFAFILMSIVVFITFRSMFRSGFILLAVASDIISTLAVVDLLGIRVGTAGIAALLMLIGYAVDTDILLTSRVFKQKVGTVFERITDAMRTGLLMTGTAITASIVGVIFAQSDTIRQIMLIVTIGLVFDMIYTWFQNAGILRWYLERKNEQA